MYEVTAIQLSKSYAKPATGKSVLIEPSFFTQLRCLDIWIRQVQLHSDITSSTFHECHPRRRYAAASQYSVCATVLPFSRRLLETNVVSTNSWTT